MTESDALLLLGDPPDPAAAVRAAERRTERLEQRRTEAPTEGLRARYELQIELVRLARDVLRFHIDPEASEQELSRLMLGLEHWVPETREEAAFYLGVNAKPDLATLPGIVAQRQTRIDERRNRIVSRLLREHLSNERAAMDAALAVVTRDDAAASDVNASNQRERTPSSRRSGSSRLDERSGRRSRPDRARRSRGTPAASGRATVDSNRRTRSSADGGSASRRLDAPVDDRSRDVQLAQRERGSRGPNYAAEAFAKFAVFRGRTTRRGFFTGSFMLWVPNFFVASVAGGFSAGGAHEVAGAVLLFNFGLWLVLLVPKIALRVRRLNDAGIHWIILVFPIVPFFLCLLWPGERDTNRHGPNPRDL